MYWPILLLNYVLQMPAQEYFLINFVRLVVILLLINQKMLNHIEWSMF